MLAEVLNVPNVEEASQEQANRAPVRRGDDQATPDNVFTLRSYRPAAPRYAKNPAINYSRYLGVGTVGKVEKMAGAAPHDAWERTFIELGKLTADDDFIPPAREVLSDLEALAEILKGPLPFRLRFPTIEHDSSTGLVTLAWFNVATLATFSISLLGKGRLYSAYFSPQDGNDKIFPGQTISGRELHKVWAEPLVAATLVDIQPAG